MGPLTLLAMLIPASAAGAAAAYRRLIRRRGPLDGLPPPAAATPESLRQTLKRQLQGEKVIVVANREPYIHELASDGSIQIRHPASGLVTALEPVMEACSGTWVAHGSGTADRRSVDAKDHLPCPPGGKSYLLRRVWISEEEERGFYYGFANEGLWPLCHLAHQRPVFRSEDWRHYKAINQRFADAACDEADGPTPIVLVQDYHFALVPQMIRQRLPRHRADVLAHPLAQRRAARHLPLQEGDSDWPAAQQHPGVSYAAPLQQLHRRDRSLPGGAHRPRTAGHRARWKDDPHPALPDLHRVALALLSSAPAVEKCRSSVLEELQLPPDTLLGVGVDRLDYTKGIEERLLAVEQLLDRYPQYRGRFVFVQVADPSRTAIARYKQLALDVEQLVVRINDRFGSGVYRPILLRRKHHEPPDVFRYYRAAAVCYVSSLHDGMNLVAKEFVAARDDLRGVLVLSSFTGASRELTEALVVNPYDSRAGERRAGDRALHAGVGAARAARGHAPRPRGVQRLSLGRENAARCCAKPTVGPPPGRTHPGRARQRRPMKWLLAGRQAPMLRALADAKPVLAFDFDGVLAPIEMTPSIAGMRPRTRALLRRLSQCFPCVVISGRSLASLSQRLRGIPLACLVGNHGSEWPHPDRREPQWTRAVRGWRRTIEQLADLPGVEIEDKRLSLSIHYRGAPNRPTALRKIESACERLAGARIVGGNCVVNITPIGSIHKGRALQLICQKLRRRTALFIGDDFTDEDAFGLRGDWPGLLTARVGRLPASRAAYFLHGQEEVDALLEALIGLAARC